MSLNNVIKIRVHCRKKCKFRVHFQEKCKFGVIFEKNVNFEFLPMVDELTTRLFNPTFKPLVWEIVVFQFQLPNDGYFREGV